MRGIRIGKIFILLVMATLLGYGLSLRFINPNWSQGANLHPDEYGLTSTLTRLSFPANLDDYFNTRLSPISPYRHYDSDGKVLKDGPDNGFRWGQWPVTIIRLMAQLTGQTGYDDIRLLGRALSAIFDSLTVLAILIIGWKIYGFFTGLLGAVFSSLAVMQIQQSHFMTVDNFAVFFTTSALLAAVFVSQTSIAKRGTNGVYALRTKALLGYGLFGMGCGMATASKINLLPLFGIILPAAFINVADIKLASKRDLERVVLASVSLIGIAFTIAFLTFRFCQPMAFRAEKGNTTFLTLRLNPDWIDNLKLSAQESSGAFHSPPAEQWVDRPIILYPLLNMVFWGLGLPLGLAGWFGFGWAFLKSLKSQNHWKKHLVLLIWTGGFFLFMATRWVASMRYFLPIYPCLCLFAAWTFVQLFQRQSKKLIAKTISHTLPVLVLLGTLLWANGFIQSVYGQENTRIKATRWVMNNIPAPIHLETGNDHSIPISTADGERILVSYPFTRSFVPQESLLLTHITFPHIKVVDAKRATITAVISSDAEGREVLGNTTLTIPSSGKGRGVKVIGLFENISLTKGVIYYLHLKTDAELLIFRNTLASEEWDESVPVRFGNFDPFGSYYRGLSFQVRWPDNQTKREKYLNDLQQADYIILASQRSLWSVSRLPAIYPLTIAYYRALFDGRLGYEQSALFQAPIVIGRLHISDLAGQAAWVKPVHLPIFNFNPLSAEEAFSVYDHAPVWVFRKKPAYDQSEVERLLNAIEIGEIEAVNLRNAKVTPFSP